MRNTMTALLLLALMAPRAVAQDVNILMPVDSIERRLALEPFEVIDRRPSRGLEGERTYRTAMAFPDGAMVVAKWARAAPGGEAFNNSPRFELAAYELQKLFLDEDEFVVPPTVARTFPLWVYQTLAPDDTDTRPTFRGTRSVLVAIQYWLFNITADGFWDRDRFDADSLYARHFGNFNIMTYLVRHGDVNEGNYLISTVPENPRVFSVDNGVSFSSVESDRGYRWRQLRVDRLPAATIERLRALAAEDLVRQLETVAEFRIHPDGTMELAEPGPNLDSNRGVRTSADRVQLGLTSREISAVWGRVRHLLEQVDRGRIEVF